MFVLWFAVAIGVFIAGCCCTVYCFCHPTSALSCVCRIAKKALWLLMVLYVAVFLWLSTVKPLMMSKS